MSISHWGIHLEEFDYPVGEFNPFDLAAYFYAVGYRFGRDTSFDAWDAGPMNTPRRRFNAHL